MAAGVGLWAVWQFVRGGRAGDIKTVVPEPDFSKASPAWDRGRFPEDDLGPPAAAKPSPATSGEAASLTPGELLERLWDELRSAAGRATIPAIKALLLTVAAGCLIRFLSSHISDDLPGYIPGFALRLQAGEPSPWFVFEKYPGGHRYRLVAFSWSWAIVALGALACWLYGVIRKIETGGRQTKLDRFVSRGFRLWGWIVVAALGAYSLEALWLDTTSHTDPAPSQAPPAPKPMPPMVKSVAGFPPSVKKFDPSVKKFDPGWQEGGSGHDFKKMVGPERDSRRAP